MDNIWPPVVSPHTTMEVLDRKIRKYCVIQYFGLLFFVVFLTGCQQQANEVKPLQQKTTTEQGGQELVVEAACGQCLFELPGEGCDLAVRIDGESFYVDGTGIDDHGDSHSEDGFCNAIRRARVKGRVENGRFVAIAFKLLPVATQP